MANFGRQMRFCVLRYAPRTELNIKIRIEMVDIFSRLEKNAGGPIGQYMAYAHGYFAFPKLEGEIGPHMRFRGKEMLN